MRRAAAAALVLLAAGWALTLWVPPWNDESVNDLFVYRSFAAPVLDGGLPYRDVAFEYPPLAVPAIALPRPGRHRRGRLPVGLRAVDARGGRRGGAAVRSARACRCGPA